MSTPRSTDSDESVDIPIEFISPSQVEDLYEQLIEKHNDIVTYMEVYETTDDDIHELREKKLDKYELELLAEAYEAAGKHENAKGLRLQAEECDERIEELVEELEDIDIMEHFFELYKMEIKKETLEVQMVACETYLDKVKRRAQMEAKKATIKAASPRRYPQMASPSRLRPLEAKKEKTPESEPEPESEEEESSPVKIPVKAPVLQKLPEIAPIPQIKPKNNASSLLNMPKAPTAALLPLVPQIPVLTPPAPAVKRGRKPNV